MFQVERVGRLDQHGIGRQSIYTVWKQPLPGGTRKRVCNLHLGVGYCCAMNMIQNLQVAWVATKEDVEGFVKALSDFDFAMSGYPHHHGFRCKDFFYATHAGYYQAKDENLYKHFFNHPGVSLVHQWPSASEPGHDVVLLKLHVK